MNEKAKNFLHKSWNEPRLFFFWLALFNLGFFITGLLLVQMPYGRPVPLVIAWPLFISLVLFLLALPAFVLAWIPPLRRGLAWVLRRRWLAFATVLTLIALFEVVENFRGKHAWEKFKQEAAAQGEKLEVADIIPPPVPEEQNFAALAVFKPLWNELDPKWRLAHIGPEGGFTNTEDGFKLSAWREKGNDPEDAIGAWSKARRTDLEKLQQYYRTPPKPKSTAASEPAPNEFPTRPQPQSPAEDILFALSKFDPIIAELRAAEARPLARFPIRYEDGFGALLPHISRTKGCVQVLALRAEAELVRGETGQALADIRLAVRVMNAIGEEPFLISQLVRIAQIQVIAQPVWEGVVTHRWADAQLLTFQEQFGKLDFLTDFYLGMRGERAFSMWTVDYLRRERNIGELASPEDPGTDAKTPLQNSLEDTFGNVLARIVPGGWFDQNKVSLGRMHRDFILPPVNREKRLVSPAVVNEANDRMMRRLGRPNPYDWFGPMLLPALNKAAERCARAQVAIDLARVACGLERHRLARGSYPETLDALAPRFIDRLPHDLINGQPLKYRRTEAGEFVLYSVGWNEKDDGGKTSLKKESGVVDWQQGDWVWRFPAK